MHVVILAGGKSSRMGEDKALMFNTVERLQLILEGHNDVNTVVLCGGPERNALFSGTVWNDPQGSKGVLDVIKWARKRIDDDVLILPCDAFNLNAESVDWLLQHTLNGGVAVDSAGQRQPTVSVLPKSVALPSDATTLRAYTERLPTLHHPEGGSLYDNFNRPSDLKGLSGRRP